ncbi:MAG: hypothetical protein U0414_35635 [Polyangiaceae bacterium]
MAKKRHLTVLQDHETAPEEPRSTPFLLLVATASSLVAWIIVATLVNGLLGAPLARAGDVVTAIVNLVGLAVAAGAGGALLASMSPRSSPWVPRASGALTAAVGWGASLAMARSSDVPNQPTFGTWCLLLGLMLAVSALGAGLAFTFAKKRLARSAVTPPPAE